ncbi:MAG: hypothetical protein LUM44_17685 [Pyrinomonadaceae bacterium]|nr:hypothetical protein [Pyrinomonadaceae bacterium]
MRPQPPEILINEYVGIDYFIPSPELEEWARKTFLDDESPLHNPDHAHLLQAHIGYLWTNVPNSKGMRAVAGTAEIPSFRGAKWQKHRQLMQMQEWFGAIPDFVITLDANYCFETSDTNFCALVEHELYHCAQALDEFGEPKFNAATDRPIYTIKDHDVTEFIGVVARYGIGSVANGIAFVEAANSEPLIAHADISKMCGNCL